MLTIICGEDTVSSRDYIQGLKADYKNRGYETVSIPTANIDDIHSLLTESSSLFSLKRVFFTERLIKYLKQKKTKQSPAPQALKDNANANPKKSLESKKNSPQDRIQLLIQNKEIAWYNWEPDMNARQFTPPKGAIVKEFKPATSIFKLLDDCYPNNLSKFLYNLNVVSETQEESFIFAMLCKHIRNLLLVKIGKSSSALQSWQINKLQAQANFWSTDKLVSFYEGLGRIDISIKTSSNPHGVKKSLDILSCYYL